MPVEYCTLQEGSKNEKTQSSSKHQYTWLCC